MNKLSEVLFTIYLNNSVSMKDLNYRRKNNLFFAAKLYPLNATTNLGSGVSDIKKMVKYFSFLEDHKIHICIHGEHVH